MNLNFRWLVLCSRVIFVHNNVIIQSLMLLFCRSQKRSVPLTSCPQSRPPFVHSMAVGPSVKTLFPPCGHLTREPRRQLRRTHRRRSAGSSETPLRVSNILRCRVWPGLVCLQAQGRDRSAAERQTGRWERDGGGFYSHGWAEVENEPAGTGETGFLFQAQWRGASRRNQMTD